MNALYELSIVRRKLVIKQLREITLHDLVAVRETLNSIDFIMGNDDLWEYNSDSSGCRATTKVRLYYSEEIWKFINANLDKMVMDSIDQAFLTDLTQVHKITRMGKSEQEVKSMNLDKVVSGNKKRIMEKINQAVLDLNELAKTMGDIL